MAIIEVRGLTKNYRRRVETQGARGRLRSLIAPKYESVTAVSDLDFDIAEGELVGYIGPNGAGKSTSIKMLAGILVPTSGDVKVAGIIPYHNRQRNAYNIGAVFGQRSQLFWDLPLIDSFRLIAAIFNIPKKRFSSRLEEFVSMLQMDPFLHTPVRQLSLGQRMRADFAASMMHEPRVIYLDEPTIGLDLLAKHAVRDFIAKINRERGTTVLLTTHDLADIEKICRRMIIIDQGRLVYDGSVDTIKMSNGSVRKMTVRLAEPLRSVDHVQIPDVAVTLLEQVTLELHFDKSKVSASDLIRDLSAQISVLDVAIEEPQLEAVIANVYRSGLSSRIAAAVE